MSQNFKNVVLSAIKKQWQNTNPDKVMDYDKTMNSDKRIYYFAKLEDNLIKNMSPSTESNFLSGSGNELKGKMKAIYSSSAMTYNLLGNNSLYIKNNYYDITEGKFDIAYERKVSPLKLGNPANLDACLTNDDEIIFFEMKMTEWLFNKPSQISASYFKADNYFDKGSFVTFCDMAKALRAEREDGLAKYQCKFKHYDAFQMFKHTLGIYNEVCFQKKISTVPKLKLINCMWTINDISFFDGQMDLYHQYKDIEHSEQSEFEQFKDSASEVINLFREQGIKFDILLISVKDLISILVKDEFELIALRRYL